jgi:hypothetical protein
MSENNEIDESDATKAPATIDWTSIFERATGSADAPIPSKRLRYLVRNIEDISPQQARYSVTNAWENGRLLRVTMDLSEGWYDYHYFLLPEPSDEGHAGVYVPAWGLGGEIVEDEIQGTSGSTGPAEEIPKAELTRCLEKSFEDRADPVPEHCSTEEIAQRITEHIDLLAPVAVSEDAVMIKRGYDMLLTLSGLGDRCLQAKRDVGRKDSDDLADRIQDAVNIYYKDRDI